MLYWFSKAVSFLALPSSLIFLMIAAGLALLSRSPSRVKGRARGRGLAMAWAGCVLLAIAGLSPVGNWLIRPLEERIPAPASGELRGIHGIIILGGFEDGWVSRVRPGLALNEAAERLTAGLRLAVRNPEAKIVFTGAGGGFLGQGRDAARPVGAFLADVGIQRSRIILEDRARNTFENALFLKKLLKPGSHQRWVLVTSAYHMPRAVGVFRKQGFGVLPLPVDYRTQGAGDDVRFFARISDGLKRTDLAVHEWLGLASYWIMGRTDLLMPVP